MLCLLLLTPGIVEYLSGSSQLSLLVTFPPLFFAFLGANLALYGPGALLIREAMVRWRKGWGSVLLLGAAYGILEEGVALNTLFYSKANPVGALGYYGHWLGVNWVWTSQLLIVHALWSIALPILLLGLALPETQGRSLLSRRGLGVAFGVLALDVVVLLLMTGAIYHFYAGPFLLGGAFLGIAALVYAAYRCPRDLLRPSAPYPRRAPWAFFVAGVAMLPGQMLIEDVSMSRHLAPVLAALGVLGFAALELLWVIRNVGERRHVPQLIALAGGLIAPLMVLGFVIQIHTGVGLVPVALGDASALVFLRFLWRKYAAVPAAPASRLAGLAGIT